MYERGRLMVLGSKAITSTATLDELCWNIFVVED